MAKDKRTRDQKRKAKLAKNRQVASKSQSLAYTGTRYKTEELIETLMHAEIGIYEAFVISDRRLLDLTVKSALETMIKQMRTGTLPPRSDASPISFQPGHEQELIIVSIRRNWVMLFETAARPSKEERIGVLRTILGSLEAMRTASPASQGYLLHIAEFLTKRLGVNVQSISRDAAEAMTADELQLLGGSIEEDDLK